MTTRTFETLQEFRKFLNERAGDLELPLQVTDDLAALFAQPAPEQPARLGEMHAVIRARRWVIRDDDLRLFDSALNAVRGAAAASFFMHVASVSQAAAAALGMITWLVVVGRQALKKGAKLDDEEWRLLLLLKANDGVSVADCVAILNRVPAANASAAAVEAVLARLQAHPVADGSTVAFVSKDGRGHWRAANV